MEKFDAFISLGGRCMTAASLSKNGLRETAGPFDWNISDLEGVINILANDFADFLDVDNIDVYDESLSFYDKKYHISFVHDVKNNFIDEYNDIRNKYKRRIDRLRKMQNGCICYVYLSDKENDIDYIMDNKEYIDNVIDTKNGNEIIFIFTRSVGEKIKVNCKCKLNTDIIKKHYQ